MIIKVIPKILLLFILSIIVGCSKSPSNYSITPWATDYLPTAIALTMSAEPRQFSTFSPSVTPTNIRERNSTVTSSPNIYIDPLIDNSTPTIDQKLISLTPTFFYPEAKIQITSPGSLSKVISPINLISYAQPGNDRKVYIELIGEDGEILFHDFRVYQDLPRLWAPVNISLPFICASVLEYGRLQIYTIDQFQRIISLNSVSIFLQSDGLNRIYLNELLNENIVITSPTQMESIFGGSFQIEGKFHSLNKQPVRIDLITNSGIIVGTKTIEFIPENNDIFSPFNTKIEYQVSTTTQVRMTINQLDVRTPGAVYIYSQEIILNP